MKKKGIVLMLFILPLTANIYGQTVLIRHGSSVGYWKADDMEGMSYSYGLKILLMSNNFQRYGVKVDHINILADEKYSFLSAGLFIEQVLFKYFNMGIGTVGYINTIQWGENPFGLYTHLGFNYFFAKWFCVMAAYQSEFIFRQSFTMNSTFLLELGFRF